MSTILPNNVVRIPTSLGGNFFKHWFEFLEPFHKLTEREVEVVAAFVKHRYVLSKVIKDDEILDKVVMSEDVKRQIREECKMSLPHFQVIMGKLRKQKLIIEGKLNKRFIPSLPENPKDFKLMLYFEFKDAPPGDIPIGS